MTLFYRYVVAFITWKLQQKHCYEFVILNFILESIIDTCLSKINLTALKPGNINNVNINSIDNTNDDNNGNDAKTDNHCYE